MSNNSIEEIKIRKHQNTLRIVGSGIILMGLWTIAKTVGLLFFQRAQVLETVHTSVGEPLDQITDGQILVILLIFILIVLLVELAMRLYVGVSAIRESRGKRGFPFYILLAALVIVGNLNTIIVAVATWIDGTVEDNTLHLIDTTSATAVIIELTSMIMLIEMIVASLRIRKHNRQMRKQKAAEE
ncbi:MAG: hypothetical protein J5935_06590 [Lachnospiraceae bacterium]|nr:hypothetical protein [Lachnospiraceae bacterium]